MNDYFWHSVGWNVSLVLTTSSSYGKALPRFAVWLFRYNLSPNHISQAQPSLAALLSVLSTLLALFSSHYTYQPFGQPILKTLLSLSWMRRLNSLIRGSSSDLILVTLKLFDSMSAFASGRERKVLLESFAWDSKVSRFLVPVTFPKYPIVSHFQNYCICGAK